MMEISGAGVGVRNCTGEKGYFFRPVNKFIRKDNFDLPSEDTKTGYRKKRMIAPIKNFGHAHCTMDRKLSTVPEGFSAQLK